MKKNWMMRLPLVLTVGFLALLLLGSGATRYARTKQAAREEARQEAEALERWIADTTAFGEDLLTEHSEDFDALVEALIQDGEPLYGYFVRDQYPFPSAELQESLPAGVVIDFQPQPVFVDIFYDSSTVSGIFYEAHLVYDGTGWRTEIESHGHT